MEGLILMKDTIYYLLLIALSMSLFSGITTQISAKTLPPRTGKIVSTTEGQGQGQANGHRNSTLNFQDLTLKLKTPKQEFLSLEPIAILITLENQKNDSVECNFALGFSGSYTKLLVGKLGQELFLTDKILSEGIARILFKANKIVKPQDRYQTTETLSLNLAKLFPSPGQYQIQLLQLDSTGQQKLYSNKITIKISEPTGKNLIAYQHLSTTTDPNNPFSGGNTSKDKEQLEYLASYFGDTVYGKEATLQLARLAFIRKDFPVAVKHLEVLLADKDFAFGDEVLFKLAQSNLNIRGNEDKARPYFDRLVKEYPNSKYASQGLKSNPSLDNR